MNTMCKAYKNIKPINITEKCVPIMQIMLSMKGARVRPLARSFVHLTTNTARRVSFVPMFKAFHTYERRTFDNGPFEIPPRQARTRGRGDSTGGDGGRGVAGNDHNFYYAFWLPWGSLIHELLFWQAAAGAWGGEPRPKWPAQLPWVAGMTVVVVFTVL